MREVGEQYSYKIVQEARVKFKEQEWWNSSTVLFGVTKFVKLSD